jgi:hypothetical protein
MIVSQQLLANPTVVESSDAVVGSNRNILPSNHYVYDNLKEILSDEDNYENIRQQIYNRLSKRRAQAKANLAGLWGVPTRFA